MPGGGLLGKLSRAVAFGREICYNKFAVGPPQWEEVDINGFLALPDDFPRGKRGHAPCLQMAEREEMTAAT